MSATKTVCGFVLAVLAIGGSFAQGTVIVSDSFTNDDPTTAKLISGRTPGVSLSGGKWQENDQATYWGPAILSNGGDFYGQYEHIIGNSQGNPSPSAQLSTDVAATVSIASAGSYTKPDTLTISGDLYVGTLSETSLWAVRGVGLGFFSSAPSGPGCSNNFTGLTLHTDGALTLAVDGNHTAAASAAYTGTFNAAAFHSLSYAIDLTTGGISDIVLDGQSKSMTTTAFTGARTALAGFYVSSDGGGTFGNVDNFSLTTVPEPSAIVMLSAGLLGLLAYAWRKRKQ